MKTKTPFLFLSVIASMPMLIGASTPPERQPLRIIQTSEARFPWMLSQRGITEGWARIAITVDSEGRLLDLLPIAYTRPQFAEAASDALRRWHFEPAWLRGEPIGTQTELLFQFQAVGVVVTFDIENYMDRKFGPDEAVYRPRTLRELDRVPTPLTAAAPVYSTQLADKGVTGSAVVEFFIDENGTVRLPAVLDADFEELGILAVAAVKDWRFEPPTSGDRPVLARVRQTFRFSP